MRAELRAGNVARASDAVFDRDAAEREVDWRQSRNALLEVLAERRGRCRIVEWEYHSDVRAEDGRERIVAPPKCFDRGDRVSLRESDHGV